MAKHPNFQCSFKKLTFKSETMNNTEHTYNTKCINEKMQLLVAIYMLHLASKEQSKIEMNSCIWNNLENIY